MTKQHMAPALLDSLRSTVLNGKTSRGLRWMVWRLVAWRGFALSPPQDPMASKPGDRRRAGRGAATYTRTVVPVAFRVGRLRFREEHAAVLGDICEHQARNPVQRLRVGQLRFRGSRRATLGDICKCPSSGASGAFSGRQLRFRGTRRALPSNICKCPTTKCNHTHPARQLRFREPQGVVLGDICK